MGIRHLHRRLDLLVLGVDGSLPQQRNVLRLGRYCPHDEVGIHAVPLVRLDNRAQDEAACAGPRREDGADQKLLEEE